MSDADFEPYDAAGSWDGVAAFWDAFQGDEGSTWQRELAAPPMLRMLGTRPGARVLELACGNGQFTRRLASRCGRIVATDVSPEMLRLAAGRTRDLADRIEYRPTDVTRAEELRSLGPERFDAALCSMGMMDFPVLGPLYEGLAAVLAPGAPFVFSMLHPCFKTSLPVQVEERVEQADGVCLRRFALRIERYATPFREDGVTVSGQPHLTRGYHRSLADLLAPAFAAGFTLDGLEEPNFPGPFDAESRLARDHMPEIPPILVARVRAPTS